MQTFVCLLLALALGCAKATVIDPETDDHKVRLIIDEPGAVIKLSHNHIPLHMDLQLCYLDVILANGHVNESRHLDFRTTNFVWTTSALGPPNKGTVWYENFDWCAGKSTPQHYSDTQSHCTGIQVAIGLWDQTSSTLDPDGNLCVYMDTFLDGASLLLIVDPDQNWHRGDRLRATYCLDSNDHFGSRLPTKLIPLRPPHHHLGEVAIYGGGILNISSCAGQSSGTQIPEHIVTNNGAKWMSKPTMSTQSMDSQVYCPSCAPLSARLFKTNFHEDGFDRLHLEADYSNVNTIYFDINMRVLTAEISHEINSASSMATNSVLVVSALGSVAWFFYLRAIWCF